MKPPAPADTRLAADPYRGLVASAGRAPAVVAFEAEMVSFFVNAADLLGVPKSVAAIYAVVFASAEALTFSDVESRLSISKGSVSQGLRVLREVGALKTVTMPGDRREFYAPDLELRRLVERYLDTRLKDQISEGKKHLVQLARTVPSSPPAQAEVLRTRLRYLNSWHTRARALLPVVRTFFKLG